MLRLWVRGAASEVDREVDVGTKLGWSMCVNADGIHASVSAASRIGSAGRGSAVRIQVPTSGSSSGRIS